MRTKPYPEQRHQPQAQRGVALIAALFVLVIMSVIVIAVLADVKGEMDMSALARNSERALKLAETGIQVARATIQRGDISGEIASVDGFSEGGYFLTTVGSGLPGNEKWEHWHYDAAISGNNVMSEINTPIRPVWQKEASGRNGSWSGTNFTVTNIFGIIAGGAYFPIEYSTDTEIRAADEYSGSAQITFDPDGNFTWIGDSEGDKSNEVNLTSATGYNKDYAVFMSPMASYTNLSSIPGQENPQITQQTIYYTYNGENSSGNASANTDNSSTVRLRAINSLCNNTIDTTKVNVLWEFDTGIHGLGTAPAFFDPSPDQPGDELIYFAVMGAEDLNLRDRNAGKGYPISHINNDPDKIYIFAVVDTTGSHATNDCLKTGSYRLKWIHRFPDPEVNDWTDYPAEQVTGTDGQYPPYARRASDMTPLFPEDDLLVDFRDRNGSVQNQVRGDIYLGWFPPASISPVVVNAMYQINALNADGTINMTTQRKDTFGGAGDPADPLINLYMTYVVQVHKDTSSGIPYNGTAYNWSNTNGVKKELMTQVRVIALRDRLDGSCNADGTNCTWNWDSPKSLFPTFKWTYRVPAHDPDRSDARPWNGYGEFNWDTWYEQQIAPMIGIAEKDQDDIVWANVTGLSGEFQAGRRDLYPVIYPAYESLGYVDASGSSTRRGPYTSEGSPVNFSSQNWAENHMMIMAIRDTWDDYMEGRQTNPMYDAMVTQANAYAVPEKSRPVEPFWTHKHDGTICDTDGSMFARTYEGKTRSGAYDGSDDPNLSDYQTVITYTNAERDEWKDNQNKKGFERPYTWNESLWTTNVYARPNTRGTLSHGWSGSGISPFRSTKDIDVEGETSAFCRECLDNDGLIVQVFNHDLNGIEDLRLHAVNAKNGQHVWDFNMPAVFVGDYFNATPAIANNRVFVAYASQAGVYRGAILQVLKADTGAQLQQFNFDRDADALILSPTIANGAVYAATYDFNGTMGASNAANDTIRIFAFSPVLRLFSMGVYPVAYNNESTIPDLSASSVDDENVLRAERKLQVWISGGGSKWEEITEIHQ
ncbi:hypothetical protein GF339_07495 [candidate division KSB3 bacterium]|uniref:Uncharacterized protein n=1 Tax=candidate division KSB3 bacterium TaxID=2044937 RepID=A0A9D5JUD1_9BACT|nr:hypothetical protein [candidate division KSB3 bacterium]MBD3324414.1 hypothetical protein [candidate division KSB3 bacterium]